MTTAPLIDCYVLLGVERDSDEVSIRKAYRRRALELHPDKNPDNPKAEELFLAVKAASETLLDKTLRAALDAKLAARDTAAARIDAMDSRRARLRSELEAREKAAADSAKRADTGAKELSDRIERLRQEGRVRQEAFEANGSRLPTDTQQQYDDENALEEISQKCAVKLTWTLDINSRLGDETISGESNEQIRTISEHRLRSIFKLYGIISSIIARRAVARSACIIFASADSAEAAIAVPPDGFLISRIALDKFEKRSLPPSTASSSTSDSINGTGKRRRNEIEEGDPSTIKSQTSVPASVKQQQQQQNGKFLSFQEREVQVLLKLKRAAEIQLSQSQKKR